jgi:hypothetical protein
MASDSQFASCESDAPLASGIEDFFVSERTGAEPRFGMYSDEWEESVEEAERKDKLFMD